MKANFNRRTFLKATVIGTGLGLVALRELFGDEVRGNKIHLFTHAEAMENGSFCRIEPAAVSYRDPRDFELTYKAGIKGLRSDQALMIRCISPVAPQALTVRSSHPDFVPEIQILENVKIPRVLWIESSAGGLPPGERLIIEIRNYALPKSTAACAFAILEVDPEGDDPEIGSGLTFTEVPSEGGECVALSTEFLQVVLPTRAQANTPMKVRVAAFDEYWLATPDFTGVVGLSSDFPLRDLPEEILLEPGDEGAKVIEVTPLIDGVVRIEASHGSISAESNPCVCTIDPVDRHVFWGDYHKHSYHCDGHLFPEEHFRYARKYASLDWGMMSPHDMWPAPVKGARNWPSIHAAGEAANEPGEFVTFQGYEWTHDQPFSAHDATGHKVVIFLHPEDLLPIIPFTFEAEDNNPVFMPPTTLMNRLVERAGDDVILIPHHMPLFKWWVFPEVSPYEMGGPLPAMERQEIDALQPVAEVFSKVHGNNESWDLQDWIKSPTVFYQLPILHTFWQDGLMAGARVGAVCAGDNHYLPLGHPDHTAFTAVLASSLTRESIFRAIQNRKTYGSSGPRIFIDFKVSGAEMGDIVASAKRKDKPSIQVALVSPVPIDYVEVVKVSGFASDVAFTYNASGARECGFTWEDTSVLPEDWVCYYLRVHMDGDTAGAWTSPVWLEFSP